VNQIDNEGCTPLYLAIAWNTKVELVRILIQAGANPFPPIPKNRCPLEEILHVDYVAKAIFPLISNAKTAMNLLVFRSVAYILKKRGMQAKSKKLKILGKLPVEMIRLVGEMLKK
jgi:ankyrin repeat protein